MTEDLDHLKETVGWAVTGIIAVCVWIWKASREYATIQNVKSDVAELKANQEEFITKPAHDEMQAKCQDHIARIQAERIYKVTLAYKQELGFLKDDLNTLNANVCKIMGKLDVTPVPTTSQRRAADDG